MSNPETIELVAVDDVKPSPYNRRAAGADVADLAASIAKHGVIQALTGRRVDGHVELVTGERRWRAADKAGLEAVPIVV